jgi:hypothetical protein
MVKGMVLHGYGKVKPVPVPEQTRDTLSRVYPYLCHTLSVVSLEQLEQSRTQTERSPPHLFIPS